MVKAQQRTVRENKTIPAGVQGSTATHGAKQIGCSRLVEEMNGTEKQNLQFQQEFSQNVLEANARREDRKEFCGEATTSWIENQNTAGS